MNYENITIDNGFYLADIPNASINAHCDSVIEIHLGSPLISSKNGLVITKISGSAHLVIMSGTCTNKSKSRLFSKRGKECQLMILNKTAPSTITLYYDVISDQWKEQQ